MATEKTENTRSNDEKNPTTYDDKNNLIDLIQDITSSLITYARTTLRKALFMMIPPPVLCVYTHSSMFIY